MSTPVIIPNWNGASFLPTCLDSLRRQSYRDSEVMVVDNASTDGSRKLLQSRYPEVRVLPLPQNRFFSAAVNEGIRATFGEVVVLLNNDTEADPHWLEELLAALAAHPEAGMAASKMLLFDRRDILNAAGDFYRLDGVAGNRGAWERDEGQYDHEGEVFGASAGAAAYRRAMLEEIGLFDEDFVAYCEDVDLSFRARLAGYRCVFAPKAVVYHRLSGTGGGPFASYYCGRNFINLLAKDMPGELLRAHWREIVAAQMGFVAQSLRHLREPAARARLRGQVAGLLNLPRMLRKRRQVQALRRIALEDLEAMLRGQGEPSSPIPISPS